MPAHAWFRPCLAAEDDDDRARVARVVAVARLGLSTTALVATVIVPTEPARYADLVRGLLAGYAVCSGAVLLISIARRSSAYALTIVMQAGDVCVAALLMLFTSGPDSPFSIFLLFGLLTAGLRWNDEKRRRREAESIVAIMRHARVRLGLRDTTEGVFADVLELFHAARAVLVVQDRASGDAFRWDSDPAHRELDSTFVPARLDPATGEPELFEAPGDSWHATAPRGSGHARFDVVALDAKGRRLSPVAFAPPASFLARYPCRSILAVTITLGDDWTGRTFLFDPEVGRDRARAVRFGQRLAREVGPATYNVFLLHRMRAQAEAQERARLAREIHDGVMQSLIASEMQVESLRRQALAETPRLVNGLARLQSLLQQEVLGLRDLTQRMRSLAVTPAHSLEHLADIVERFQRETGICARFVTNVEKAALSPRACREVALIVLEALVNIRKHSGARHVLVRFAAAEGLWKLTIEDDGCGFEFAGRRSHVELDAAHVGPAVIKERVNALGGELTLESRPGEGTRLEIAFH